jgi:hypothetical protein
MRKIERLKKNALEYCTWRGHKMSHFVAWPRSYMAECKVCGLYVQVTLEPLPNEIQIGGTAVARTCTKVIS